MDSWALISSLLRCLFRHHFGCFLNRNNFYFCLLNATSSSLSYSRIYCGLFLNCMSELIFNLLNHMFLDPLLMFHYHLLWMLTFRTLRNVVREQMILVCHWNAMQDGFNIGVMRVVACLIFAWWEKVWYKLCLRLLQFGWRKIRGGLSISLVGYQCGISILIAVLLTLFGINGRKVR